MFTIPQDSETSVCLSVCLFFFLSLLIIYLFLFVLKRKGSVSKGYIVVSSKEGIKLELFDKSEDWSYLGNCRLKQRGAAHRVDL